MDDASHLRCQWIPVFSSILSVCILILSLFNFYSLSLTLNVIATGLALSNHLFIALRERYNKARWNNEHRPGPSLAGIITSAFVWAMWTAALSISAQLAVQGPPSPVKAKSIQRGLQIGITSLIGAETLVMGMYLWISVRARRHVACWKQSRNVRIETKIVVSPCSSTS